MSPASCASSASVSTSVLIIVVVIQIPTVTGEVETRRQVGTIGQKETRQHDCGARATFTRSGFDGWWERTTSRRQRFSLKHIFCSGTVVHKYECGIKKTEYTI
jgi:hypothetical protein